MVNIFFDTNYISEDTPKIRYAGSLLRGPAVYWWRVIVTKPMDYATLPTREGQTGPWPSLYFIESSSVGVNTITMKGVIAARAVVYAVDIREAEASDKGGDLHKLLADVPHDLAALLKQYSGIFPDDLPTGLPPQQPHDHKIELEPGAHPTVQRQFRLTQPGLDELRKQLDYLLEKEFIRPSSSPFAAPILFTPKKDGGFRLCIDYRALNRATIKSRYPIPRVDELIDQLRTARVFLKIDLRGGYHQIRVNPPYCPKTTFRTRYGSFEYNVMPFGLTNTLATFQMTMSEAFRPLFDKCVIVYLDDILIYSPDRAQHLQDIEVVLKILSENRLLTKASMREFLLVRLEFLGHIISAEGVEI
ncbi:unnamed protein product, partial [Closterium sp. NIES-54]